MSSFLDIGISNITNLGGNRIVWFMLPGCEVCYVRKSDIKKTRHINMFHHVISTWPTNIYTTSVPWRVFAGLVLTKTSKAPLCLCVFRGGHDQHWSLSSWSHKTIAWRGVNLTDQLTDLVSWGWEAVAEREDLGGHFFNFRTQFCSSVIYTQWYGPCTSVLFVFISGIAMQHGPQFKR